MGKDKKKKDNKDTPASVSDEARIDFERAEADQILKVDEEDLMWLMKSPRGRRFAWKRLSRAGIYTTSFRGNSYETAFNEGARNQGLELMNDIHKHCSEQYMLMVNENKDRTVF